MALPLPEAPWPASLTPLKVREAAAGQGGMAAGGLGGARRGGGPGPGLAVPLVGSEP